METLAIKTLLDAGWPVVAIFLAFMMFRLEKKIEKLEEQIQNITEEFVSKEEHYRDVSGWRGEINKLEDKIDKMMWKIMEAKK